MGHKCADALKCVYTSSLGTNKRRVFVCVPGCNDGQDTNDPLGPPVHQDRHQTLDLPPTQAPHMLKNTNLRCYKLEGAR